MHDTEAALTDERTIVDGSAFGLEEWGSGYFRVSPQGTVRVHPSREADRWIDLYEVIRGLEDRGLTTPVVVRFADIVRDRLRGLRQAFDAAIETEQYRGGYSFVFPVKVNQQRHVCEEIRDLGHELGFGLEAGSKPELWAVLGMTGSHPGMPIICNGFKDDEYIETVILATKLGRKIIPVVEQFRDLELLVKHATRYGVRPSIGVRVKPAFGGGGRWKSSVGDKSKFGLSAGQLLAALEYLQARGMADCLTMLHFHVGSQVSDIRQLKTALGELGRLYAELKSLGAGLNAIDVGGGLGVDYDGTSSASESSVNYTIREYASDVVFRVRSACDDAGVPHPHIYSESGRAMAAYSSVLVVDVLGRTMPALAPDVPKLRAMLQREAEPPQPVQDLLDVLERAESGPLVEVFHDATQARDESLSLFNLGYMSLPLRASAEQVFWAVCRKLASRAASMEEPPEELSGLTELLSEVYLVNFSIFQSMPDTWAIDQLFPICPIHRLDEAPTRRAILADMTCDSDGKVDNFVGHRGAETTLPVHDLVPVADESREYEPYYLGVFLVGAYQETLGDLHNLFGDTHAVHVSLDARSGWTIDEVVEGDTVKKVLEYVQYDTDDLRRSMRHEIERAVRGGIIEAKEGASLLKFYESGLEGYTYLE